MYSLKIKVDQEITLKLLDTGDAEELFSLVDSCRQYLRQWLRWVDANKSLEDIVSFIKASQNQFASNKGFQMGIWYKGQLAGVIGFHVIDWQNNSTGIGYWLGERFQGCGIMTKCCRALVDYAFKEYKLNRVEIRCAVGNAKSRAIPERLGFKREGVLRQAQCLHDRYVDLVAYGMLAEEWENAEYNRGDGATEKA